MPLTKQYLRYVPQTSFGVVCSRESNAILVEAGDQRQLVVAAPALEDVIVWDLRRRERTAWLRGDKHEVSSLALSPNHTSLAVGYEDGSVRLWALPTQTCVCTFSGHKSAITCQQFDHSGTMLVSGSKDTDVIVWDVLNEAGLYRLRGHKGVITDCRFMSSHQVLITGSKDSTVKLWHLPTQHCFQTLVGHRSEVWSIELVSMETRLVTASGDSELRVFEITSPVEEEVGGGASKKTRREGEGEGSAAGHEGPVVCSLLGGLRRKSRDRAIQLKADPSGNYLACLSADSAVEVFNIRSGPELEKVVRKRKRKAQKRAQKSGADPAEVMETTPTAEDELVLVHTLNSKAKIKSFDLLATPTGLQLLLAMRNNSLELHTLTPSPPHSLTSSQLSSITAPGHRSDIRTVCFNSDNTCIASGSSNMVKVWNTSSRQCVCTMPSGYALCSTFVPGDRHLLVGCKMGDLQLFSIASGSLLESVKAHDGALWSLGVSPDRRGFVTGSADHQVKFWEFELVSDEEGEGGRGRKRLSVVHVKTLKMSEDVLAVKYSPDHRLLAVALLDCTVKVFFADSLKFFLSLYGHKLPVLAMDISSDSTLLVTSSADKNIKIWGLDFGDCHKSIFAHDDSIMTVQFVPQTHLLFSGSKDRTVKCWDADSFEHILTLEGHHGEVWCLAVSSDGQNVVTGSHDYSLRLWERTREPLVLSEEKEMEREAQFEEAIAEGGERVIPGEGQSEAVMAGKKTVETVRAAERIMEALQVYVEESAKLQEYREDCRAAGKELPRPQPHPMLVAMGNPQPERYVLDVVRKIRSSELEEALLVMPFSEVTELLRLLDIWIKSGWEIELSCRCLFFLLRVHHHQVTSSPELLPVVDSLRCHTHQQVDALRDVYGFNLAGLRHLQKEMESRGTAVFGDATHLLSKVRKTRKLTVYQA